MKGSEQRKAAFRPMRSLMNSHSSRRNSVPTCRPERASRCDTPDTRQFIRSDSGISERSPATSARTTPALSSSNEARMTSDRRLRSAEKKAAADGADAGSIAATFFAPAEAHRATRCRHS